jgi:hypothetical protein
VFDVNILIQVEVRQLALEDYPAHVAQLENFAWKPIIEMLTLRVGIGCSF